MSLPKLILPVAALLFAVVLCVVESTEGMGPSALERLVGAKNKRQIFDASCKGIYDRQILGELERVCESCYNLYRKPIVSTECRRNCYSSEIFESCLRDLMMHEYIDEYKEKAFVVAGGKK